jgi:uncharacterized membrane protein (DUF485 family)
MAAMLLKVCVLGMILTFVVMFVYFKELLNFRICSINITLRILIGMLVIMVIFIQIHIYNLPLIASSDFLLYNYILSEHWLKKEERG